MLSYIIRRILLMIPTLLGITAVTFFVMVLSPGGYAGLSLNLQGGQTEGKQSLQIREQFMRRYGMDLPVVVQYFRWLNEVSPLGFPMSAQVRFTAAEKKAAKKILAQGPLGSDQAAVNRLFSATISAAQYTESNPAAVARQVNAAIKNPTTKGKPLLKQLDPPNKQYLDLPAKPAAARPVLIRNFTFLAATANRVLFSRWPRFKEPNLGISVHQQRVSTMIAESLPITLLLNAISIPLIYLIAIVTGVYAARKRGQLFDVSSGTILLGLWSVPTMWAGVLLIGYFANEQYFNWFPIGGLHSLQVGSMSFLPHWTGGNFHRGWLLDMIWHLVLPVICLSYNGFAVLAKLTRGAVLENLTADFVRTARAKGVDERRVLFQHVLRTSLLPLITVAASILPAMLGGSLIVETIFSIHGMGKLMVTAAFDKDREVVMAITLISGILILVSWLIRDIWYAIADPRVSYE